MTVMKFEIALTRLNNSRNSKGSVGILLSREKLGLLPNLHCKYAGVQGSNDLSGHQGVRLWDGNGKVRFFVLGGRSGKGRVERCRISLSFRPKGVDLVVNLHEGSGAQCLPVPRRDQLLTEKLNNVFSYHAPRQE